MSIEDKQVIDMANSSGERRDHESIAQERQKKWIQMARKLRRQMILKAMIPALLCSLVALLVLAAITSGQIAAGDMPWAAAVGTVLSYCGGMCMADALRC